MNEKIKELALISHLPSVMLLNYYGKMDALTDSEQEDFYKLERFAELIIKECVSQLHLQQHDMPAQIAAGLNHGAVAIKEHFGIE